MLTKKKLMVYNNTEELFMEDFIMFLKKFVRKFANVIAGAIKKDETELLALGSLLGLSPK
jgi:hypothetical protein